MNPKSKYAKLKPNSQDAYARLKPITDAAQAGSLKPWSQSVIDLLARYKVNVQRLEDIKAEATLSFPTSIKDHNSMAIGFRYAKSDGSFAEDLFVFIEDVGLICYYRGSQEVALPEYSGTHHAKIVLREFLPDFQKQFEDMQKQINDLKKQSVDYISDEMHLKAMSDVSNEFNEKVHVFRAAHGSSSAVNQYAYAMQKEATKKRRELQAKKALSDKTYKSDMPEVTLAVSAQASKGQISVKLSNKSSQTLIAITLWVNGEVTELNQQFTKQYTAENIKFPEGIFNKEIGDVAVELEYGTLGGLRYKLTQIGRQEERADGQFNVIFSDPSSIEPLLN